MLPPIVSPLPPPFQHFGTRRIAFLFSPIIIVWLLANFSIGIYNMSLGGGRVFNVRGGRGRRKGIGIYNMSLGGGGFQCGGGGGGLEKRRTT